MRRDVETDLKMQRLNQLLSENTSEKKKSFLLKLFNAELYNNPINTALLAKLLFRLNFYNQDTKENRDIFCYMTNKLINDCSREQLQRNLSKEIFEESDPLNAPGYREYDQFSECNFKCSGFRWLIKALSNAVIEKNTDFTNAILSIINKIIEKCGNDYFIKSLSDSFLKVYDDSEEDDFGNDLSTVRIDTTRGNGFSSIIFLLSNYSICPENVKELIEQIIQKMQPTNRLYFLSLVLDAAASNYSIDDNAINHIVGLIEKEKKENIHFTENFFSPSEERCICPDTNPQVHAINKRWRHHDIKFSAFYHLIRAADIIAAKNPRGENSTKISTLMDETLQSEPSAIKRITSLANTFNSVFYQDKTWPHSDDIEYTIHERIADILQHKADNDFVNQLKSQLGKKPISIYCESLFYNLPTYSPAQDIIFLIIITLNNQSDIDEKFTQKLLENKEVLKPVIMKYLENIKDKAELEKLTGKNTLLGKIIDHQRGFFHSNKTETRKNVERLIKKHEHLSLSAELKTLLDRLKAEEKKEKTSLFPKNVALIQDRRQLVQSAVTAVGSRTQNTIDDFLKNLNNPRWKNEKPSNELLELMKWTIWILSVKYDLIQQKEDGSYERKRSREEIIRSIMEKFINDAEDEIRKETEGMTKEEIKKYIQDALDAMASTPTATSAADVAIVVPAAPASPIPTAVAVSSPASPPVANKPIPTLSVALSSSGLFANERASPGAIATQQAQERKNEVRDVRELRKPTEQRRGATEDLLNQVQVPTHDLEMKEIKDMDEVEMHEKRKTEGPI